MAALLGGLRSFLGRQGGHQAAEALALLAGVEPGDAPTFAAAAVLCLGMAVVGSLAPAWRAVRVDPLAIVRAE